ncbi:hypothetical protein K431DRAFT_236002 [Polychaeton citri CBS 116435]|uniref:Uncharacterized protein n=1 Tax=Polychaeton citri CBS 116435 TaxID=1314669 RepID=A0A9P4Q138_9PEZI|nr:hypothetical protein K431DRAFT_236002 [Polychaeton citri CBS 116435]
MLGERVSFDKDEAPDAVYKQFKGRKNLQRKTTTAAYQRATTQVRGHGGKRRQMIIGGTPKQEPQKRKRSTTFSDHSDEDEALMETTLPDYMQKRMRSWGRRKETLGDDAWRTPPSYDDICFSEDERMEELEEKPRFPGEQPRNLYENVDFTYSPGTIPASMAQWLRDYQFEGAEFMHRLFVLQEGGILGDDMGLGKTIMVIAFLTAAFGKTSDERDAKRMRKIRACDDHTWYPRILLVCPGGLMANWQAELERWGWWQVYVYHEKPQDKEEAMAAAKMGMLEIMITTYHTYRLNADTINQVKWDAVIADECHIIKERTAEITRSMTDINALCRIGLTGTAIQNKYEELWTLLNWSCPGRLGPISTWKSDVAKPLKVGQSHNATVEELSRARDIALKLKNNLLPRFMLRRTKELLAGQLPKKSDRVIFCPLSETQADAYDQFCDSEPMHIVRDAHRKCPCNSKKTQGACCYSKIEINGRPQKWTSFVFPALFTLRSLCNHLALAIPSGTTTEKEERAFERLKLACPNHYEKLYLQRDMIKTWANRDFCGKWRVLDKLLKLWRNNGDKVLVFSHSVKFLGMLSILFKTTSYNVSYLDGKMPYAERQRSVDDFNADPNQFVFLISTKAGGVGLNITSANKVVVVDPHWNPAVDQQAQDRAYRIGQTRDVEVFRLVSAGTIEEIVYARQIYKQQQANIGYNASSERRYFAGVQDQKERKGEIFGLENMFRPHATGVVLRDIVNKTNIAESRAGFQVVGLDLEAQESDNDDTFSQLEAEDGERAAMSLLAEEILDTEGARKKDYERARKTRKTDPVQAILASVGVQYTHENAEVIGTSRIETMISSRARKAGHDFNWGEEAAYGGKKRDVLGLDGKIKYRFKVPQDVLRRQFCTMAKEFKFDDVTEFALVVEGWTQEQRRAFLTKFYKIRREKLAEV